MKKTMFDRLFRNSPRGLRLLGLITAASALWGGSAQATFFTWANVGTAWNTSTGANWIGGVAPASSTTTGTAVFGADGASVMNPNLTAAFSIGAINFNTGAYGYTIGGAALTVGAGGISDAASTAQIFSNTVNISATQTWAVSSGTLRLTNTLDLNNSAVSSRNLTLTGTGVKLFEGTIQNSVGGSSGSLILTDPGAGLNMLTLSGNNTFNGNTSLAVRTQLNINSATALGVSALVGTGLFSIDNTSGAAITLTNNNNITISTSGTLVFVGSKDLSFGSNTVTLNADRGVVVNASKLSLGSIVGDSTARHLVINGSGTLAITGSNGLSTGGLTLGSGVLELDNASALGDGTLLVTSGTLTAGSTLNHTGTALTTLSGDATISGPDMTFAGGLSIVTGSGTTRTLTVNNTTTYNGANATVAAGNFAKSGTGTLVLAGATAWTGTTFANNGTLALGANNVLSSSSKLAVNGGTLDLRTFNNTVSSVTLSSGAIAATSGTLTSTSAYDVRSGTVSAVLAGSVGLNKTTSGTVILSGNNVYTGTTAVSAGTLIVAGGGSITSNVSVAGLLEVKGTVTGNVVVTGTAGGSGTINGTVSGSGLLAPGDPQTTTVTQINPTGGLDFAFQFTGTAPNYASATASVNDLIRLTGGTPFTANLTSANVVTVDFSSISLVFGQAYSGGLFTTQSTAALLASISGASFVYTGLSNGISDFTVSTQSVTDPFGLGTSGSIVTFTAVPEPQTWALVGLGFGSILFFRRRAARR